MNSSTWGYLFLVLGLLGILLINLFGNITINNEQDYYLLKEVTKSAMLDSVDIMAFREGIGYDGITSTSDPESMHCITGKTGEIRIVKERFVESFIRHFAENVDRNKKYTISFKDIDECPPKVTVTIKTEESLSWFAKLLGKTDKMDYETDTADVVNILNAILESEV
ncbi:MAG: hypothetical protein IJN90_03005 [Bacilli bacterium]|nr:hypothetical protein [Bacilli bacterium]